MEVDAVVVIAVAVLEVIVGHGFGWPQFSSQRHTIGICERECG
jgi:hypothetical protein